jgi:hypothetical protein
MSVRQIAWHGLGQIVDRYPTSSEAIKFAGLDYEVVIRPLFTLDTKSAAVNAEYRIPDVQVPGCQATIRTDTDQVLGIVGSKYEVVQYRDAFAFFDSVVDGEGIMYETAGRWARASGYLLPLPLPGRLGNAILIRSPVSLR